MTPTIFLTVTLCFGGSNGCVSTLPRAYPTRRACAEAGLAMTASAPRVVWGDWSFSCSGIGGNNDRQ